jgi:two-component system, cell cycle sensor histidine kinase and response regulator CckA
VENDQTERQRLSALRAYRVIGTGADPSFDRITDLASRIFHVPFASVSLVDENLVWFKSHFGVNVEQVAREGSPSALVVEGDGVVVIPDARSDARLPRQPTIGGILVGFYAGAPLITPEGHRIGALSLFDTRSRSDLTADERGMLQDIAAMVMDELALQLELKRIQETTKLLQASEARFRTLMESAAQGIIGINRDGVIQLINRKAESLFGYSREELIGQTLEILLPESQRETHVTHRAGYFAHPRARPMGIGQELQGRRSDGSEFPVEISLNHVEVEGETIVISFITDISERTKMERQVRQSQKMEAVGQLAGGVAHDFNNLLTVISGYSNMLLLDLVPGSTQYESVEEISKASDRAAVLTQQLLAFSRHQVIQPKRFDVNQRVLETHRILKRLIGEDIQLELALGEGIGQIMADPGQIDQVIINLVVNARDAMPNGGRLLIETAPLDVAEAYAASHFEVSPGPHIMLAITDSGTGMTPDVQSHIFEPFFTTKPAGRGTGLGLATVYGIVKQANGAIFVYSEPGLGTTFKIVIPVAADGQIEEVEVVPHLATHGGVETVLVVEDEESVRKFVRKILEKIGYLVIEAVDGADALKVIDEHGQKIDLVLTDVVMPKVGGPELIGRLREIHPGSRVLYMSGYTDRTVPLERDSGAAFIQKPFTPSQLGQKLKEVFSAEQSKNRPQPEE